MVRSDMGAVNDKFCHSAIADLYWNLSKRRAVIICCLPQVVIAINNKKAEP